MYSFNSRVRYSEVDKYQRLDLTSIINYFQDCSTFHSEEIGNGISFLTKKNRAWLLNGWQIVIHRIPSLGEEITVSTWPYDFKAMYGYRNFLLSDHKGEVLAFANSIWVYMDTLTHRPVKLQREDQERFILEPPFQMEYAPRKIDLPDALDTFSSFQVVRSNIDTNDHVNNGQYIKMAEEFIPEGLSITGLRAEYRMSAVLGDTIIPMVNHTGNIYTVVLANKDKVPFTIIEFQYKDKL